jgi:WD40 repeat protein
VIREARRYRAFIVADDSGQSIYSATIDGLLQSWSERGATRIDGSFVRGRISELSFDGRRNLLVLGDEQAVTWLDPAKGVVVSRVAAPSEYGLSDFALSADWLAVASPAEDIRLLSTTDQREHGRVEGGESVYSMAFDRAGTTLASACSFQGGIELRVDRVVDSGLTALWEASRSDCDTSIATFVDKMTGVAFSPDGRRVACFESTCVGLFRLLPGWRGNIASYDVASGDLLWERQVGAFLVNDERTLDDLHFLSGYFARIAYDLDGNVVCGSTAGAVVVLDGATGERRKLYVLDGRPNIRAVTVAADGRIWAASADGDVFAVR